MPDWIILIVSAFGGLGGIAAVATWLLNWRKAKPEIARMYEEMATKQAEQIEELRTRVNRQDRKIQRQGTVINKLRECLREWEEGIRMLVEQIMAKGMTPVWTPRAVNDEMADYGLEEEEKK